MSPSRLLTRPLSDAIDSSASRAAHTTRFVSAPVHTALQSPESHTQPLFTVPYLSPFFHTPLHALQMSKCERACTASFSLFHQTRTGIGQPVVGTRLTASRRRFGDGDGGNRPEQANCKLMADTPTVKSNSLCTQTLSSTRFPGYAETSTDARVGERTVQVRAQVPRPQKLTR
jgi:hypothetical protein